MSNMKVGGRVYRDVEKMNLEQLHEVRVALATTMQNIVKKGQKLNPRHPASFSAMQMFDKEMKELDKRMNRIDALAKPLIVADTAAKLAQQAPAEVPAEPAV